MQFVVKDITDQQTALLDNALRMVFQLLASWRSARDKEGAAAASEEHMQDQVQGMSLWMTANRTVNVM